MNSLFIHSLSASHVHCAFAVLCPDITCTDTTIKAIHSVKTGGRARPRGPRPGLPALAAEEKKEDDLQIHSEGRAAERGAERTNKARS